LLSAAFAGGTGPDHFTLNSWQMCKAQLENMSFIIDAFPYPTLGMYCHGMPD
jgi:hypothetical protein